MDIVQSVVSYLATYHDGQEGGRWEFPDGRTMGNRSVARAFGLPPSSVREHGACIALGPRWAAGDAAYWAAYEDAYSAGEAAKWAVVDRRTAAVRHAKAALDAAVTDDDVSFGRLRVASNTARFAPCRVAVERATSSLTGISEEKLQAMDMALENILATAARVVAAETAANALFEERRPALEAAYAAAVSAAAESDAAREASRAGDAVRHAFARRAATSAARRFTDADDVADAQHELGDRLA